MKAINRLLAALLVLALSSGALAATSSSMQWQILAGGSGNNGAGFDPAVTMPMSDLASTSSSSTTPNFSSASYYFVTGDANNWVFVGSGTGWQVGWYKITSVTNSGASNAYATVDAAIGHVVLWNSATATTSMSTVAGCGATTGGSWTIDYTQVTGDAVHNSTFGSAAATPTLVTNSVNTFTKPMVGNCLQITGKGTGNYGILGFYEIVTYTDATDVTVVGNTNAGSNAMVSGTAYVGGSAGLISDIDTAVTPGAPVAGNTVWQQAGAYSMTASITFSLTGSGSVWGRWVGYKTYRGDGWANTARANSGSGLLPNSSTYFPVLTFTSTHTFAVSSSSLWIIEGIDFQGSVAGTFVTTGANSLVRSVFNNSNTTAGSTTLDASAGGAIIFDCDVIESGATANAETALLIGAAAGVNVLNNVIQVYSSSATSYGITCVSNETGEIIIGNQIIGNGAANPGSPSGIGIYSGHTGLSWTFYGNTIVGFVDDINVITGSTHLNTLINNMLTDTTGAGYNNVIATNQVWSAYNRFRNNGSTIATPGTVASFTNYNAVTSGASSDYTSLSTGDLRLVGGASPSPAVGAGFFPNASIGSLQLSAGAGAQTAAGYSQ